MINSEKLGKILQWAGLVGLGIIGVKTFKAHKKECLESEKREEEAKKQRIVNMGLTSEKEVQEICTEEDPMIALPKLLQMSAKWDIGDFWNGGCNSSLGVNSIIVSQEIKEGGKRDWNIRIKLPAFVQNLPKTPHYREQIEETLKEFGLKTYWLRVVHGVEYHEEGAKFSQPGEKDYAEVSEVAIQNFELDAFKSETEQNGAKRFFSLFEDQCYDEIEEKLGFTQKNWLAIEGNLYLNIAIPYNEEMGLSRMQDLLIHLLGTQVFNPDLGGRYPQNLGPVVFQASKRNPLDNTIRYNLLSAGDIIEVSKRVYYDEDEQNVED